MIFAQFLEQIDQSALAACTVRINQDRLHIAGDLDGADLPTTLRDVSVTLSAAGLREQFKYEMREFGEVVCEYGAL
jgi:hypothetical protein